MTGRQEFETMVARYTKKDGVKALGVFIIVFSLCVIQGILYRAHLSETALTCVRYLIPLINVAVCFLFVIFSGESLGSIGLKRGHIRRSLLLGALAGVLTAGGVALAEVAFTSMKISSLIPHLHPKTFPLLLIVAAEEEIVFRGYIQTRLYGLIRPRFQGAAADALLFLLIHYPVKWVRLRALSLAVISPLYAVELILLHFACDYVYQKTNSLYGSMLLHLIYNIL
jgi:membrane protease YdiL (CAAX protease family)